MDVGEISANIEKQDFFIRVFQDFNHFISRILSHVFPAYMRNFKILLNDSVSLFIDRVGLGDDRLNREDRINGP